MRYKKNIIYLESYLLGVDQRQLKKNIALINKHPLIAYTIIEANKSKLITDLVVSSDDNKIRTIAIQYGCQSPFKRPAYLSNDTATSVDCDLHAVKFMEKKLNKKYDFVIELMCTNPFKTVKDIDGVIKTHIKTNAETVISMMKLEYHPIRIKKIKWFNKRFLPKGNS